MGITKQLSLGIVIGLGLAACAGAKFPYHDYVLYSDTYQGRLQGPEPKDDLDLKVCMPDTLGSDKCHVFLKPEFDSLKQDYLQCKSDLIACQRRCK